MTVVSIATFSMVSIFLALSLSVSAVFTHPAMEPATLPIKRLLLSFTFLMEVVLAETTQTESTSCRSRYGHFYRCYDGKDCNDSNCYISPVVTPPGCTCFAVTKACVNLARLISFGSNDNKWFLFFVDVTNRCKLKKSSFPW